MNIKDFTQQGVKGVVSALSDKVLNNAKKLAAQTSLLSGNSPSSSSSWMNIVKSYTDPYKKVTGGYDLDKIKKLSKRKEQAQQFLTAPGRQYYTPSYATKGILGKQLSLLAAANQREKWVKNELFRQAPEELYRKGVLYDFNSMPYEQLKSQFPSETEELETQYNNNRITNLSKPEDVALERIRLSQVKFTKDYDYDPIADTYKAKHLRGEYIDPNKQLYDDFEKTSKLYLQSIPAEALGYETEAMKEAIESGDLMSQIAVAGGSLTGFYIGLKGVGRITKALEVTGKTTQAVRALGIGRKGSRLTGLLVKSGIDFTLLGQIHSTVRGDSLKEHFKSGAIDFVSGVGFSIAGKGIDQLPKVLQPIIEGSVWATIVKAQGGDNQTALIQGIMMGGMRGFGIDWRKSGAVEEMFVGAEKYLKAKKGDIVGIVKAFQEKTKNLKQGSLEYQKAEAAAVALLYPRQVFGMVKNVGSFQESKLAGLFGKAKFKEGERLGIEKAAPLPDNMPTTRILEEIKNTVKGGEVSKQFIQDLTNKPEVKQVERDMIRSVLDEYKEGKINIQEFESKVRMGLLPLTKFSHGDRIGETLYENITLPKDQRGKIENYGEIIYESPIPTSAGDVHFGRGASVQKYFAHTRFEDVANTDIRRIIEVQSDLFQKGRLEEEGRYERDLPSSGEFGRQMGIFEPGTETLRKGATQADVEAYREILKEERGLDQLSAYRNIWHERIIREEIKRAVEDGKKAVLFPTGETAMKIEGLDEGGVWFARPQGGQSSFDITNKNLAEAKGKVVQHEAMGIDYVITDILGEGKFKAVTLEKVKAARELGTSFEDISDRLKETFDINIKADTSNPIYKFYEKEVAKYLKREYPNMERITDAQGVEWNKVEITPKLSDKVLKSPTFAFLGGEKKLTPEELASRGKRLPEKGKFKDRLEKKLETIEGKVAEIEFVREKQAGFTREEIKDIRKAKKLIDQTGDVETFAKKNKQFAENLLEKITEIKGVGRDEAFEFIKDMPTTKEFTKLKRSARLTQREATKLQRRIEGSKLVKNLRESRDLAQKIKSDIIQYAKVLPLEQRGKLLAKIKNAKTPKDLKEAVEKIMELQDFADTKLYKKKIDRELKGAVLKEVSGVKHGKFGAKAQAILDYVKAGRGKTIEQGQKIKLEAQQKIQENLSKFKEGEEIPESVLRENARLSLLGVEGMSSSELKYVLRTIRGVKEKGFEALFIKDFNKQAEIQRLKDVAEKEFSKGGKGLELGEESGMDLSKKFNPISRMLDRMTNFTLGIRQAVRKAAFTPKGSKGEYVKGAVEEFIGERLMDARRVYAELNTRWYQSFVKGFADALGAKSQKELNKAIKELSKEKVYFKGKNADGIEIEIKSYDLEAIDYYMKMRDKTLESSFDKAMKWTSEIKEAISSKLPENLKNYADWLVDVHFKNIRKDIRPAYEDKFKTYMPNNPNYSPLKRKGLRPGEDVDLLFGDMFPGFASLTPSAVKTRTGIIAPIEPQNLMEMTLGHHNRLSRFVAFDSMVRDFNSIFKDSKIEGVIRQNVGSDVYNKIIRKIDDITRGGVDTKLVIGGVNKVIRNFARSKLLFNVGTMIKQVTSYPVLGAKMPIVDLATGTVEFMTNPSRWTKFFLKESIALQERIINGYEKEVVLALKKGSKTLNLRGRELNLKDFAWQSMLMPTRAGDLIPVLPGMTAKYLSVTKNLKAEGKLSEMAIHKKALREAEFAVLDTQQSSFVEDLSRFQLDGSFWQTMSTFGTTPIQYYRESILALREGLLTNRIGKKNMMKQLALYWIVAPTLFQYVANGFRWDMTDQIRAMIAGPMNYYPAVGGLLQTIYAKAFQGEEWRDVTSSVAPVASVLNDLTDGVVSSIKAFQERDKESIIKAFKDVYSFGATIIGLPETAPRVATEGAYDLAVDKTDNPLRLFWSEYALDEKQRIGKSYSAYELVQDSKNRILSPEEGKEITEAVTKAVESGEMTDEQAKRKIGNVNRAQFNLKQIARYKELGYDKETVRIKVNEKVNRGEITEAQAKDIYEAF